MAQLKEILEIERNRMFNGPYSTIYLFQEGTFFRAYEWSAWLCCRYVNQFKATRREQKISSEVDSTLVLCHWLLRWFFWHGVKDNRRRNHVFLPAAGNRNGTSVNNVGSNGNYWSASYNNANNAWNVNFNSSNLNTDNNNNRYNGQSVRLVRPAQPCSFVLHS